MSVEEQALTRGKYATASMAVRRAATGLVDLYVSVDYVPPWKVRSAVRYGRAVKEHIKSQPADHVFVECPNHPVPFMRRRKQIA